MTIRVGLALPLVSTALVSGAWAQKITARFVEHVPGRPVAVTTPPGETARVFVVDKLGRIFIVKDGKLTSKPFLDWRANTDGAAAEGGLLAVAFHPEYATSGKLYISYTAPFLNGASVISQLSVDPADPDRADPTPEQILWGPYPQDGHFHKGGDLHFGPDGMLYYSLGDGGDGATIVDNAQDLTDSRGSILRFDVDLPPPHIPPDNPFVGDPSANDEIWVYGLRNPFHFSIDPLTADMYIADVGQVGWEEIDWLPGSHSGGANFGWPCKEANDCRGSLGCSCQDPGLVGPIHAYDHSDGCAVIGGVVYRGSLIPSLYGHYLFADFCQHRIWSLRWDGTAVHDLTDISEALNAGKGSARSTFPVAFGSDAEGEVYLLNYRASGTAVQSGPGERGRLWKIVADCGAKRFCKATKNSSGQPAAASASGSFSLAANGLRLSASALPHHEWGLFLMSATQDFQPGFGGGNGNLCLAAPIGFRGNLLDSGSEGSVAFTPDLTGLPQGTIVLPGDTWHFQYWTRDHEPAPTSNTSDGVSVSFCP